MKKHLIILLALLYAHASILGQVSNVSYTFSPTAQYNFWDENSGIEDGLFLGGQFGFGFGQNVELSAVYLQSFETNNTFPTYDFTNSFVSQDLQRQLNIRRIGGNLKVNLSKGALLPFLSLGTGVQRIQIDELEDFYSSQRIYFDAGLGIKLSVADRYTLNLSAVNHYFEMNPVRELLTLEDREALNVDFNDFESELLDSWAVRASLIIYLGGNKPEDLSDEDKALLDSYSTDYSGFSLPLEPTVGRIRFHERLPYRDTWFVGGATGFNFGPLVGLRAYYWRGLQEAGEDENISTETDDIAIYGAEGRFQLAAGQGLKPYLLIGGGLIDPLPGYVGRFNFTQVETAFASGGIGINIPFSKAFKFDVYGKAILTSAQEDIVDTAEPDDILTSWAYGASLNLVLGKKKKVAEPQPLPLPGAVVDPKAATSPEGIAMPEKGGSKKGTMDQSDSDGAGVDKDLLEIAKGGSKSTSIMIMTPAEFENIIDEILDRSAQNNTVNEVEKEIEIEVMEEEGDSYEDEEEGDDKAAKKAAKADKKAKEKAEEKDSELREAVEENRENIEEMEEMIKDGFRDLKKQIREMDRDADDRMDDVEDAIDDAEDDRRDDMKDIKKDLEDVEDSMKENEKALKENEKAMKENEKAMKENEKTMKEGSEEGKKGGFKLFGKNQQDNQDKLAEDGTEQVSKDFITEEQRFKSPFATEESFGRKLSYDGMGIYGGFNVGGSASLNIGFRPTYKIDSTNLKLAPEAFFGFGSPSSFGIIANVIRDLEIKGGGKIVNPYVGAGLGFLRIERDDDDRTRGVINLLAGVHVASVANGRLFLEYANRNFFRFNQFVAGYRLAF